MKYLIAALCLVFAGATYGDNNEQAVVVRDKNNIFMANNFSQGYRFQDFHREKLDFCCKSRVFGQRKSMIYNCFHEQLVKTCFFLKTLPP